MTAAVVVLAVALAGATAAVVAFAFKHAGALRDLLAAGEMLNTERKDRAEAEHHARIATTARDIAEQVMAEERAKRQAAETQLGAARARVHELLAAHLKEATDDEIRAATAAAFGGLSPLSETADGRLLRPDEDA